MTEALAKRDEFAGLIEKSQNQFAQVAPKWLSVERLVKLAIASRSRNPKLAECSALSMLAFCQKCAETGLEPVGAGGAWPVPFRNNKTGKMEVQFIPDWRGLIQLAKQGGQIKHAYAEVVREKDQFDFQLGDAPTITHKPALKDRGEPIGAYMVAILPDDSKHIEWMNEQEIEKIRNRSKASKEGPWVSDWSAMAIKTVVRRGLKPFAASPQMQTAIIHDDAVTGLLSMDRREPIAEVQEIRPEYVGEATAPKETAREQPKETPETPPEPQGTREVHTFSEFSKRECKNKSIKCQAQGDDGEWYGTFDANIGARLEGATSAGIETVVWYTVSKFGRDIVALQSIEPPPAQDEAQA